MIIGTQLVKKVRRMVDTYAHLIFEQMRVLPVQALETREHLRSVPDAQAGWREVEPGFLWGKAWESAWFRSSLHIDDSLAGETLYLRACTGALETLLWVNGEPRGIYNHPVEAAALGGHHTLLLTAPREMGATVEIALESYAGHPIPGTQPFALENKRRQGIKEPTFQRTYESLTVMKRRDEVKDFVFDLLALCQLWERLPEESFRRGAVARGLAAIFDLAPQFPDEQAVGDWLPALSQARETMRPLLEARNGSSAPSAALIGHSHMDTAWLWPIDETIRKCARTYSNALSLMEQYPEYSFIQSTPLHAEWMRQYYPAIFEKIVQRVAEGRWEPNGGMWIECDCNLTGGESMIRQFLKGQAFTRQHFNYRADTFWLPDTFGYSAAIPQILHGCGIRYFLTTKLTWNESNTFPYDTFWWHGLDGSRVLTHFNDIHCWPDPATLINKIEGGGPKDFRSVENYVLHKDVNDRRLISCGGGPQFEMIEMARRCVDLEGCPKAAHTTVSQFMTELEATSRNVPAYHGELYFEGHRGSLTQMATIKRSNRKAELALRDAEFLATLAGLRTLPSPRQEIAALYDTLLINQFHDILPGTSIPEVHTRAIRELAEVIAGAESVCTTLLGHPEGDAVTVWNTLSWERSGVLTLPDPGQDLIPADGSLRCQRVTDLQNRSLLLVEGWSVPALSGSTLSFTPGVSSSGSAFRWTSPILETPLLRVEFDEAGFLRSLRDRKADREICAHGLALNTFLCGEDVPESWDNWNIDADQRRKMLPQRELISRAVVADGMLQFRLRSTYRIGKQSTLRQDMIFLADSTRIEFETEVDWQERHQLLKVAFPVNIATSSARHEIQFGHIERTTRPRNSYEQAMFEVCNHKWSDVSESRYGVALLNDGKYGISVEGAEMRLTLLKSGCLPDPRADHGLHRFTYALVPHAGGFRADSVVRPAYELNVPLRIGGATDVSAGPLLEVEDSNIIVEAIKPAEDGNGFIVRLYECERASGETVLRFSRQPAEVLRTNMLEEPIGTLSSENCLITLPYRAFEIITLRVLMHQQAASVSD
jgi:alpha-mannosidase